MPEHTKETLNALKKFHKHLDMIKEQSFLMENYWMVDEDVVIDELNDLDWPTTIPCSFDEWIYEVMGIAKRLETRIDEIEKELEGV